MKENMEREGAANEKQKKTNVQGIFSTISTAILVFFLSLTARTTMDEWDVDAGAVGRLGLFFSKSLTNLSRDCSTGARTWPDRVCTTRLL